MNPADLQLPDTIYALKAMVLAMASENASNRAEMVRLEATNGAANDRIARLTSIIAMFQRAQHGKRSERLRIDPLDDEQYAFVFDEIETGLAEIQAGLDKVRGSSNAKRLARPRKGFAPHLERIEVIIEPEDAPGREGEDKVLIGEDVSERLDVTPTRFRVIVTRRPKYAYRGEDGVIQAPATNRLIESGIPTEALLAQIAVAKYADGLPLYRQQAIYARDQVETRPFADGAMDGQGRVRTRTAGRLSARPDQAGRTGVCR